MAHVLSMAASSPLRESYSYQSFGRSCSSGGSAHSTGTVQHHRLRSLSGSSLSSLTSLWSPPFRRQDDRAPSRSSSIHNLGLRRIPTGSDRRSASGSFSRRTSFASILSTRLRVEVTSGSAQNEDRLLDVEESEAELPEESEDRMSVAEDIDGFEAKSVIQDNEFDEPPLLSTESRPISRETTPEYLASSPQPKGLRRWVSTLRRRKQQKQQQITPRTHRRKKLEDVASTASSPAKRPLSHHKKSDSLGSSLAFVTAVKSATATIASVSIATMSGKHARWQRGHRRSSLLSGSDPRPSVDSHRSVVDNAARQRSRKRRAKLEELIRTEESYVADIKALSNV